jgi:hypothetical protein
MPFFAAADDAACLIRRCAADAIDIGFSPPIIATPDFDIDALQRYFRHAADYAFTAPLMLMPRHLQLMMLSTPPMPRRRRCIRRFIISPPAPLSSLSPFIFAEIIIDCARHYAAIFPDYADTPPFSADDYADAAIIDAFFSSPRDIFAFIASIFAITLMLPLTFRQMADARLPPY